MVFNSDLNREIPEGWEVVELGDITKEHTKSDIKAKDATGGDTPFFISGEAVSWIKGSLLGGFNCFLNTGGNAGVKFYAGEASYSTDTWAITGIDGYKIFLFCYLFSILPSIQRSFFAGSGLKHLQKPVFKRIKLAIPPIGLATKFEELAMPLMELASHNKLENKKLAELRDFLLPFLISGKVKINDAK